MKDFYLTLLSDSSLKVFQHNKQSNFTVKLDHSIYIEKEKWEVALVEIVTPTDLYNVTAANNFFFVRVKGAKKYDLNDGVVCEDDPNCREFTIFIPEGNYATPKHLIDEIQYSLDLLLKERLKQGNAAINIAYGNNSKRVKIKISGGSDITFLFPTALAETLGIDPNYFENYIDDNRARFRYSVDLNTHRNQLYIYSDVANYTFIGDVTAPILRVVPFQRTKDNVHFHQEFVNLHYVPVAKSFIDQVNVSIKGATGEDIPFVTGKTLVKLHFRERT